MSSFTEFERQGWQGVADTGWFARQTPKSLCTIELARYTPKTMGSVILKDACMVARRS